MESANRNYANPYQNYPQMPQIPQQKSLALWFVIVFFTFGIGIYLGFDRIYRGGRKQVKIGIFKLIFGVIIGIAYYIVLASLPLSGKLANLNDIPLWAWIILSVYILYGIFCFVELFLVPIGIVKDNKAKRAGVYIDN